MGVPEVDGTGEGDEVEDEDHQALHEESLGVGAPLLVQQLGDDAPLQHVQVLLLVS